MTLCPYVPPTYRADDTAARAMIRDWPLASVITHDQRALAATQTPLFFETEAPEVLSH
ncbi:FMN-binding negative transcriptional regulator [Rhodobacteraceae bacterium F11138]|nr:FMN-binding negative transcriptional regulator [Rhodobacteraceae bacterium F11138]